MPLWIEIYCIVYIVILLMNTYYWVKMKGRPLYVIYESLAGGVMLACMVAYWNQDVRSFLGLSVVPAVVAIIVVDFYCSVKMNAEDLGLDFDGVNDNDIELGKGFSLLLTSPAYIISALLAIEVLLEFIKSN